jgi:hypothetical protein
MAGMKFAPRPAFTSAVVLSACAVVFAQTQTVPTTEAPPAQPIPSEDVLPAQPAPLAGKLATPPETKPTTGLLNDWLRRLDPENSNWDVGGQFRARYESTDHMAIAGVPGSVDFLQQGADTLNSYELFRLKTHLGYQQSPGARYYVEARSSFSVGDERRPRLEDDHLDLHQAYAVFGDPTAFPVTLKVGRQELAYGDERLVGAFDWNNLGRVFDAAKLHYQQNGTWVDGFIGRVVLVDAHHFNQWNDYDTFSGLYASTVQPFPRQETQGYVLVRDTSGQSPRANAGGSPQAGGPSARDIITVGSRLRSLPGALGGWDYEAEYAQQFGTINVSGRRVTQDAMAAHIAAGYTWRDTFASPRVGLEYNFSSGDSNVNDGKNGTFDNLFPTNHKFYGYMDFFSWQNMHNARFAFSCKPLKDLTLALDYHAFWLADTHDSFYTVSGARRGPAAPTATGYGLNSSYSSFVGSELDATVRYAVTSWANLQAGYGHFFTGGYVNHSLKGLGGSADADFFYAQVQVSF